jgi:DNA-binding protein HU-beta
MSFSLLSKKFGAFLSKQTVAPRPVVPLRRSMSATKNTLNRRDLAAIVAEEHELTIAQSERILKTVFDTIVDKVSEKGMVRISDFGCFDSMTAKARTYKPPTGGVVEKPATDRPRFKAYDSFKKSVSK